MELPTGRHLCSIPRYIPSHRRVGITTYFVPYSQRTSKMLALCLPRLASSVLSDRPCPTCLSLAGYLEEREGRESTLRSNEFSVHVVPFPLQTSPGTLFNEVQRVFSAYQGPIRPNVAISCRCGKLEYVLQLISAKCQQAERERDGMGVQMFRWS